MDPIPILRLWMDEWIILIFLGEKRGLIGLYLGEIVEHLISIYVYQGKLQ